MEILESILCTECIRHMIRTKKNVGTHSGISSLNVMVHDR